MHHDHGEGTWDRQPAGPSALLFYRLDQAYSQVGEDDTAFSGGRSPRFAVFIVAVCPTPQLLAADRAWTRSFWQALRPHSLGAGSYVDAMNEFEDDRVRASYGSASVNGWPRSRGSTTPESVPPQRQHPARVSRSRAKQQE